MTRETHLSLAVAVLLGLGLAQADVVPKISEERVVFQLTYGDIEFAFFPEVAPKTSAHIFELVTLGLYTTNHIFRVDKGFVAQTADVVSGRTLPLNDQQKEHAGKNVPLEVMKGVNHHEGSVSMARGGDPNSGASSFFVTYGDAPHLDQQYGIFGKVLKGMDILHKLEGLPTKREGIFVMPLERITIVNSYWYRAHGPLHVTFEGSTGGSGDCASELEELKMRFDSQAEELQRVRKKCLPA
uniref:Peptidyl-prolyl cis-trans isomerase n=1 Tax=Chlamydomonas chlamydogama TaxID=225041 RepID=A0A7S2VW87_9CHLO|mmetsp:Transcript_93/g.156  ORF Transcript_93/g.156 Transcript_93/m.156 type:complete len:241 (+) Transcript_93:203-925(+)